MKNLGNSEDRASGNEGREGMGSVKKTEKDKCNREKKRQGVKDETCESNNKKKNRVALLVREAGSGGTLSRL